ncbi:MAG: sulfotransferase domain-containing protein [Parvibaculaceae bacterium]|nr:sulfotransferase domain-containing protein [Parvibaculaceae bacterium]
MSGIIWLSEYPGSGIGLVRSFLHPLLLSRPETAYLAIPDQMFFDASDPVWYKPYLPQAMEKTPAPYLAKLRLKVQEDMARRQQNPVFVTTRSCVGTIHGSDYHHATLSSGAICVVRNPLDLIASISMQQSLSVDVVLQNLGNMDAHRSVGQDQVPEYYGSWSNHVASWTNRKDKFLITLKFEDLCTRPQAEYRRLTKFLKVKPERERFLKAVEYGRPSLAKGGVPSSVEEPPLWEQVLTADQISQVVDVHGPQMKRFNYIPKGFE